MGKIKQKNKVVIAMSGGLDSSVAAVLLKRADFDVIGVFMKFWPQYYGKVEYGVKVQNRCCSTDAEKKARLVAKKLGIPFYVFNFEKEFKKRIVNYFLKIEKQGQTPNPCVVCNKEIKFGLLLEKALKLGADYIATGHYARFQQTGEEWKLLKGKDKNKDQSYFLWQLNQKQLKHVLFPIGDYTREEVENLAKKFRLPFSGVKKSMEVCFIQTTVNDFLKKYLKSKPGDIIDTTGKIIGSHQGLWFYTIGQRKGIGLAAAKPFYVLDKDTKKNLLVVTQKEKDLLQKELITKNINWISGKPPKIPLKVIAKTRYRSELIPVIIKKEKNKLKIIFQKPQKAITPGQSVVFYRGEELLGGGIIE